MYFIYSVGISTTRNYVEVIKSIQNTLNVWNVRDLSLAGRTQVFKVLCISKILCLSYVSNVPLSILEEVKIFVFSLRNPKKFRTCEPFKFSNARFSYP